MLSKQLVAKVLMKRFVEKLLLFLCRDHQPVLGFVSLNSDIIKACVGQVQPNFLRIVGVHTLNQLFPFLVVVRESVVFVDDDEHTARPSWMACALTFFDFSTETEE